MAKFLSQSYQLAQEMAQRLSKFEVENTQLLKDNQAHLEQVNIVTSQMLRDRDALQRATEELSRMEAVNDEAKKLIDDALHAAEEAKKKEEEVAELLAENLKKAEDEKNTAAQAAYDACYTSLTEDYTRQADESYVAGYEEGYRLSWRSALTAAGIS